MRRSTSGSACDAVVPKRSAWSSGAGVTLDAWPALISSKRPVIPLPQQFPQEANGAGSVDSHQECPEVLAEQPPDRAVRLEVHAVVLDAALLAVDEDRVLLDGACEQGFGLLVDRHDGGVDSLG